MATRKERESATAMNKRHSAILNKLMALPENSTCVDCTEQGRPSWASWNIGAFLCIQCSGIHRSLGVHISKVRSITLDKWSPEWIQSMEKGGNKKCNDIWEYHLPKSFKKLSNSSPAIELFIRDKYERKVWHRDSPPPPNPDELIARYYSMSAQSGGLSEMSYMSQSTSSYAGGHTGGGTRRATGQGYGGGGFGSDGKSHQIKDDDILANGMALISQGWSTFTKSAAEVAAVAAEKSRELGEQISETVKDGEILNKVSTTISQTAAEISSAAKKITKKSGGGDGDFFSQFGMDESSGFSRDEVNNSVKNKDSFFSGLQSANASRRDDLPPSQGGKYAGFGSNSAKSSNGDGNYSKDELDRSAANKESFFSSLTAKNASRRDDLPPSQGGKYAGFGSDSIKSSNGSGEYSKEDLDRSAANKESFFSSLTSKNASRRDDLPPSQGGKYAGFGSDSIKNSGSSSTSNGSSRSSSRGISDVPSRTSSRSKSKDEDGWGDDWGDSSASKPSVKTSPTRNRSKKSAAVKSKAASKGDDDGWGDDW